MSLNHFIDAVLAEPDVEQPQLKVPELDVDFVRPKDLQSASSSSSSPSSPRFDHPLVPSSSSIDDILKCPSPPPVPGPSPLHFGKSIPLEQPQLKIHELDALPKAQFVLQSASSSSSSSSCSSSSSSSSSPSSSSGSSNISSNENLKIIHIGQQHKLPFGYKPTPEYVNSTAQSQLKIAKIIKSHPDFPIIKEGLCEDMLADDPAICGYVKMIFPKGIPCELDELNQLQNDFLYEYGACVTLLYLGEIPAIYKAIHMEAGIEIDKQISQGRTEFIFEPRELEAIECIKEAAAKHFKKQNGSTVILVFGTAHDFKPFCDKEGFVYEKINTADVSHRLDSHLHLDSRSSIDDIPNSNSFRFDGPLDSEQDDLSLEEHAFAIARGALADLSDISSLSPRLEHPLMPSRIDDILKCPSPPPVPGPSPLHFGKSIPLEQPQLKIHELDALPKAHFVLQSASSSSSSPSSSSSSSSFSADDEPMTVQIRLPRAKVVSQSASSSVRALNLAAPKPIIFSEKTSPKKEKISVGPIDKPQGFLSRFFSRFKKHKLK